jgi:hypothetical protein
MNKWLNIIGVIFLIFITLIIWTNWINPCPPTERIFIDTCRVDTIVTIDTLKK